MDHADALALPLDDERTFTVGELARVIVDALDAAVPGSVWVRGEVSQQRTSANGHTYFELVEKDARRSGIRARLPVVLFRTERASVNRTLRESGLGIADGIELRICGRVDYYAPFGRLQLVMTAVDPVFTLGRMAAERAQVLQRLRDEGLLAANGRLPMPLVPLRVGLVTSGGSAAYHDFVHELEASGYAFRVAHGDVRVQGAGAERRIVYALRALGGRGLDVVVVARGGGSRTDLNPFDTEAVARAIAAMPVPVITGIGHEIDRTVADEVAHTCAKTPTAAAGFLVSAVAGYDERLRHLSHRIAGEARGACGLADQHLRATVRRAARVVPRATQRSARALDDRRRRVVERARAGLRVADRALDARAARIGPAASRATRDAVRVLDAAEARVRALDPQRVLERGYSITRDAEGRVVRSVDAIPDGAVLVTEIVDGALTSRVTDRHPSRREEREEEDVL